jgi:AcrR family transcriptional regulator
MAPIKQNKKQPAETRQQLLVVAGNLILEHGLVNLTLDAVAKASGVSKGGLLHHFPSKQHLLNGLILDLHERFRQRLSELAVADPMPEGRIARAYLKAVTMNRDEPRNKLCSILAIEARGEPAMRSAWRDCTRDMLRLQSESGSDPIEMAVVHLAADGLWLADLEGVFDDSPELFQRIVARLEQMTRR